MLNHTRVILLVAHQEDPFPLQPRQLSRLVRRLQKRLLRDQRLGLGVLQLPRQLGGRVRWVRGTRDAAGPEQPKVDAGNVHVVGREEAQHVALLPV